MRRTLILLSLGLVYSADLHAQPRGGTTLPVGNIGNSAVLPTGQFITPLAAPGSTIHVLSTGIRADGDADAAEAVKTALSPDGKLLLIVTSGWNRDNRLPDGTPLTYPGIDPVTGAAAGQTTMAEWVFIYGVERDGSVTKKQQLDLPNTYSGLTWGPDASRFYVSGGANDRVYVYRRSGDSFVPDAPFVLLGHNSNQTRDQKQLYVVNGNTDSISVISTLYNTVNVLRTMEDLLGIGHLNIRDDNTDPMSDVFSANPDFTPYTAIIPGRLCAPPVDPGLVPDCNVAARVKTAPIVERHDRTWWAEKTAGFDFSSEDKIDAGAFNRVLRDGIHGVQP